MGGGMGGHGGGGHISGGHIGGGHIGGGHFGGGRYRGYRGGDGVFIGGFPFWGYDDDYYYDGGGCAWLHRRAIETGSPYWWRRYRDCVD